MSEPKIQHKALRSNGEIESLDMLPLDEFLKQVGVEAEVVDFHKTLVDVGIVLTDQTLKPEESVIEIYNLVRRHVVIGKKA